MSGGSVLFEIFVMSCLIWKWFFFILWGVYCVIECDDV